MKVLAADILSKIPKLPPDVESLVKLRQLSTGRADVRSFRGTQLDGSTQWYKVSIHPHKDDLGDKSILDATCTCPATRLCHHISAMYAVAKVDDPAVIAAKRGGSSVKPEEETAREPRPPKETPLSASDRGLKLIAHSQELFAEAAQALADGIALVVRKE